MEIFATFDEQGFPTGFYHPEISTVAAPASAVKITEKQWLDFCENQGARKWSNGKVLTVSHPEAGPVVPASVSDRQFFQALAIRGEITEEEALDAVGPGIIPAAMLALIDQLPEAERFGAKMLIRGATVFERANPLADLIGALFGWDAEALDEFWTFAATL